MPKLRETLLRLLHRLRLGGIERWCWLQPSSKDAVAHWLLLLLQLLLLLTLIEQAGTHVLLRLLRTTEETCDGWLGRLLLRIRKKTAGRSSRLTEQRACFLLTPSQGTPKVESHLFEKIRSPT